eukprot:3257909-Amphidinium_carterae.1
MLLPSFCYALERLLLCHEGYTGDPLACCSQKCSDNPQGTAAARNKFYGAATGARTRSTASS